MSLQHAAVRAAVAVSDLDAAVAFYEGLLGLEPEEDVLDGVRTYRCAGGSVLQVHHSADARATGGTVASWSVPDLDEVVTALAAKGVPFSTFEGLEADALGIHRFGAHAVAWCADPDGNVLALDNGQAC